jgi:hypothetical protein
MRDSGIARGYGNRSVSERQKKNMARREAHERKRREREEKEKSKRKTRMKRGNKVPVCRRKNRKCCRC